MTISFFILNFKLTQDKPHRQSMDINDMKNVIVFRREKELIEALQSGWDPNFEGGWPIRLAARYGCCKMVEILISNGANPHLLSESGASTLQLAVYSGEHWETNNWTLLLSCCDSSQLADGAAVAIIFNNQTALQRILETGRCNTHIPTTLTGKTLEQLAKGYKMTHLLSASLTTNTRSPCRHSPNNQMMHSRSSPQRGRQNRSEIRNNLTPLHQQPQRNLSPSVARFFQQTAGQSSLTSPRTVATSPTQYL